MTPALLAVHEELLERASRPPFGARAAALREAFLERAGRLDADHPAHAARVAAAWDHALVAGGLLREVAPTLPSPEARQLARVLDTAQWGVFALEATGVVILAWDLVRGGAYPLVARDHVGRGHVPAPGEEPPLCQGHVVAAMDGCAFLPGAIFHAPDATAPLRAVLARARALSLDDGPLAEALLRMQHAHLTLTRVRAEFAYRASALG